MKKIIPVLCAALFLMLNITPANAQQVHQKDVTQLIDKSVREHKQTVVFCSPESELNFDLNYSSGLCQFYPKVQNTGKSFKYTVRIKYEASAKEVDKYYYMLDKISKWVSGEKDKRKQVRLINWWIQKNLEYGDDDDYDSAYDAILYGKAMCGGYANVFQSIATEVGLKSKVVSGGVEDGETHAWNIVTIDGKKYGVDTCWDEILVEDMKNWKGHERVL